MSELFFGRPVGMKFCSTFSGKKKKKIRSVSDLSNFFNFFSRRSSHDLLGGGGTCNYLSKQIINIQQQQQQQKMGNSRIQGTASDISGTSFDQGV